MDIIGKKPRTFRHFIRGQVFYLRDMFKGKHYSLEKYVKLFEKAEKNKWRLKGDDARLFQYMEDEIEKFVKKEMKDILKR